VLGTFALGALGISSSAIFVRIALPAPPVVTGFYRTLFALAPLAILAGLQRERARGGRRGRLLAAAAGVLLGTDLAFWHTSIVRTSVANSSLLVNLTPIPVGLYAAWVLRERPERRFVLGAALALVGTALLLGANLGARSALAGDVLALVAALFYAGYLVMMKAVRRGVDLPGATLYSTLGACAVLGIYAALLGDPFTGFPPRSWAAFVATALISQVASVMAITWGLRWLRATFASVGLLLQPLGAALLGWLVLGEGIAALQALGGAAVLAGIFLASRSALDPDAGAPPPPVTMGA
jgi:drug/metabolite transporter (DMT)-like permease